MAIPSLLSMAVDGSSLALYFSEVLKSILPSRNRFLVMVNGVRNLATAAALGFSNGTYSLSASEQRHQLLITGNAGDSFTALDGSWSNAGTVTGTGSFSGTFNVWNSSAGLGQLLVSTTLTTSGL